MLYFVKINELRAHLATLRKENKSIGLVPTMGALHEGHLALIKAASECDVVVVSIFVNPLQFNNSNDLASYPRQLEADKERLGSNCDILFAPSAEEFYVEKTQLKIQFDLDENLEGKFRPGHFNGVGIVVAKLLNVVQPNKAYFGQKDLQQLVLVKTLVRDLSIHTEIKGCPTVRENSGLAMSSRNGRLSEPGLQIAAGIYKGLQLFQELVQHTSLDEARAKVSNFYSQIEGLEIEYFECVNDSFEVLSTDEENSAMAACVAAYVEGVRLIDNIYLRS